MQLTTRWGPGRAAPRHAYRRPGRPVYGTQGPFVWYLQLTASGMSTAPVPDQTHISTHAHAHTHAHTLQALRGMLEHLEQSYPAVWQTMTVEEV